MELRQVRDRLAREQGEHSTTATLLAILQALEKSTAGALDTWQVSRALVQAGDQRLHNDGILSSWSSVDRVPISTGSVTSGGKRRADTGAELHRARLKAEKLAKQLQNNANKAHATQKRILSEVCKAESVPRQPDTSLYLLSTPQLEASGSA
jgi:hypothetical protein